MIDMFAGVLHLRRGRLKEAIEKFEAASRIFEAREDPKALVDAMMALASTQMKAGELDRRACQLQQGGDALHQVQL